ncbi:hypothetical protein DFH09DRAFT_1086100 [Mycena vulgaris]|nr:hypothetical protein DFH09DRAFT_1105099 [Mycena vulgaris]KAJ6552324.1 hypothetical protein DFH09DRAFT_1086100 [Mycena vulgaris]
MPHQPTVTQIRLNNILTALGVAAVTFQAVSDSFQTPFLGPISSTIWSLLATMQSIKKNKSDFTQMLEQIHELLYAIIHLHISSDTGGELSPTQQERSIIKQFFRQGEMNILRKSCNTGLEQALNVFKPWRSMHRRLTKKSWS